MEKLKRYLGAARRRLIRMGGPLLRALKVDLVVANYYSPIPDKASVSRALGGRSAMKGIDMNETAQVELLSELSGAYKEEYEAFPTAPAASADQYYTSNQNYKALDAAILYSLVRKLKPRNIIEIGSGDSTRLISGAVRANEAEGDACRYEAIDPFPCDYVRGGLAGLSRLRVEKIEDVPLEDFERLGAGDILFIDSSHVLKTGGDVEYEYLELLPRLGGGVYVHIHDIYLPMEYPAEYFDRGYYLTEQYLLQAFLAFNERFEVVWGSHFMHVEHPDLLREAVSAYGTDTWLTCSFWIRSKA